jgi:Glycosyltransferase family 92
MDKCSIVQLAMATVTRLEQALFGVVVLLFALICYQDAHYNLPSLSSIERDVAWILPAVHDTTAVSLTATGTATTTTQHMAACLMVRDDNALMYEWLAYHYITMPLRHVLIAADEGSTQDPAMVAQHWQGTPLQFTIWNHSHFIHRFGDIPVGKEDENHHYLHRQRAFFTSCAEYMKAAGEQWVAFVDTDEYLVINGITREDAILENAVLEPNSTLFIAREQRRHASTASTVMEAIDRITHHVAPLHACHVVPRLLVSALENVTCPMHERTKVDLAQHEGLLIAQHHLTTLRFVQHAQKGSFYPSKWGKVLVDVSRLPPDSLAKKPKSSHRPFPECPKPLVPFETALFHLNHYLGDWARYNSRQDSRRSRAAFEERAYFSHGTTCEMKMNEWVTRLLENFGVNRTRVLLGMV